MNTYDDVDESGNNVFGLIYTTFWWSECRKCMNIMVQEQGEQYSRALRPYYRLFLFPYTFDRSAPCKLDCKSIDEHVTAYTRCSQHNPRCA